MIQLKYGIEELSEKFYNETFIRIPKEKVPQNSPIFGSKFIHKLKQGY